MYAHLRTKYDKNVARSNDEVGMSTQHIVGGLVGSDVNRTKGNIGKRLLQIFKSGVENFCAKPRLIVVDKADENIALRGADIGMQACREYARN